VSTPHRIRISECGVGSKKNILDFNSEFRNVQSAMDVRFRQSFSISSHGLDVATSSGPSPQSAGFFPGSHQNPVPPLPRYGRISPQCQTASSRPSLP